MHIIKRGLILLSLLVLGCSASTEKPVDTEPLAITTQVAVSAMVNPDINNRASPIVVRIYELQSLGKYTESDFSELFEKYESILGAELIRSEQYHLNPGDNRILKEDLAAGTEFIAVVAAYRDLNQAIWRDATVIPADKTTKLFVFVDKLGISIWKK
ncbi:MAG: type VI secretion system protein VasD [Methyloprofundus sp.]|nr:MAG: type VI secretion system protein VasD [Methyloprofundus sp.]